MEQKDMDNRFTYTYHAPKDDQPQKYEILRRQAKNLANLINQLCPESREKSLAITKLEESVMWANASLEESVMWANASLARNE